MATWKKQFRGEIPGCFGFLPTEEIEVFFSQWIMMEQGLRNIELLQHVVSLGKLVDDVRSGVQRT